MNDSAQLSAAATALWTPNAQRLRDSRRAAINKLSVLTQNLEQPAESVAALREEVGGCVGTGTFSANTLARVTDASVTSDLFAIRFMKLTQKQKDSAFAELRRFLNGSHWEALNERRGVLIECEYANAITPESLRELEALQGLASLRRMTLAPYPAARRSNAKVQGRPASDSIKQPDGHGRSL